MPVGWQIDPEGVIHLGNINRAGPPKHRRIEHKALHRKRRGHETGMLGNKRRHAGQAGIPAPAESYMGVEAPGFRWQPGTLTGNLYP